MRTRISAMAWKMHTRRRDLGRKVDGYALRQNWTGVEFGWDWFWAF
jgi:hypothetical protein